MSETPKKQETTEEEAKSDWKNNSYWQEKGEPRQSIEIGFADKKLTILNFGEIPLSSEQQEEIRKVAKDFSKIKGGCVFDIVHFVLIDGNQPINADTGENLNGYGLKNDDAIKTKIIRSG